jgi:hypothetical protein
MRRAITLAAVAALHILLLTALVLGLRTQVSPPSVETFISTLIVLPQPARPPVRMRPALPRNPTMAAEPIQIETPPLPPASLSPRAEARIDWAAEARRAAERVIAAPKRRGFGRPRAERARALEHPQPAHHAGESYRDEFGDRVYWVSDTCFITSERALPGALTAPGGPPLPRMACLGPDAPTGELFNNLPAYKKYHPE